MSEKDVFYIVGYVALSLCLWVGGDEMAELSRRVAALEEQISDHKIKPGTQRSAWPSVYEFLTSTSQPAKAGFTTLHEHNIRSTDP